MPVHNFLTLQTSNISIHTNLQSGIIFLQTIIFIRLHKRNMTYLIIQIETEIMICPHNWSYSDMNNKKFYIKRTYSDLYYSSFINPLLLMILYY